MKILLVQAMISGGNTPKFSRVSSENSPFARRGTAADGARCARMKSRTSMEAEVGTLVWEPCRGLQMLLVASGIVSQQCHTFFEGVPARTFVAKK